MRFRRMASALIVAGGVVAAGLPGGAAEASASGAVTSAGQAGYAATGAHFDFAGTWAKLPDAARFARHLGSVTVSVQLWTSHSVLDLAATTCTDASCRPGGRPHKREYHLQFAVYSRSTGALVCSSLASGRQRCPGVPRSWNRARLAPGRVVNLTLSYPVPHDLVFVSANNQTYEPTRTGHAGASR